MPGSPTNVRFRLFHGAPGGSPASSAGAPRARRPRSCPAGPAPSLWPRPRPALAPPSRLPIGPLWRRPVQSQRLAPNSNGCFHLNPEGAAGAFRAERRTRGASRTRLGRAPRSPGGDGAGP